MRGAHGAGEQGPRLPRPLPDRRREDEGAASRPSAGSGSIRRSTRNQSVLLHRQPDNVWRIDFQLGWDADPVAEKQPERMIPRVQALLGRGDATSSSSGSASTPSPACGWSASAMAACCSPATRRTACRRSARAAPTSGVQDADNLAWKLRLVLRGQARRQRCSTATRRARVRGRREHPELDARTDFITPKSEISRLFRDAMLRPRTRPRLRAPPGQQRPPVGAGTYRDSPLNTPDADRFEARWCPARPQLMPRSGRRA